MAPRLYVEALAPPIAPQLLPAASQRVHWNLYDIGLVPDHEPELIVRTSPCSGVPEIAGTATTEGATGGGGAGAVVVGGVVVVVVVVGAVVVWGVVDVVHRSGWALQTPRPLAAVPEVTYTETTTPAMLMRTSEAMR